MGLGYLDILFGDVDMRFGSSEVGLGFFELVLGFFERGLSCSELGVESSFVQFFVLLVFDDGQDEASSWLRRQAGLRSLHWWLSLEVPSIQPSYASFHWPSPLVLFWRESFLCCKQTLWHSQGTRYLLKMYIHLSPSTPGHKNSTSYFKLTF